MSVFVHAQDMKAVHTGGGRVKKWHNSVHIIVECPLDESQIDNFCRFYNRAENFLKKLTLSPNSF